MGIVDFLAKELTLPNELKDAISKGEELTDDLKKSITDFRASREDFYKEKYEGKGVNTDELKKETYNEVMHTIRNFAKKHVDFELIKDKGHKEIFEALIEAKNKEIEEIKGDDKTDALKKAQAERDEFKSKYKELNDSLESKILEKENEFKQNFEKEVKAIEQKEIERMWERQVLDPSHKFDKSNDFYVDYLKIKAEQNGFALVLNETKDKIVVKKRESGNLVDAYSFNGQTKITDPNDLIKELSTKLDIYPKSTGSGHNGLTEKVLANGQKIDVSADLDFAKALGF